MNEKMQVRQLAGMANDIAPPDICAVEKQIRAALNARHSRAAAALAIGLMVDSHPMTRPASTEIFVAMLTAMAAEAKHNHFVIRRGCDLTLLSERFAITPAAFMQNCGISHKELETELYVIQRRRRIGALLRQLPAPAPAQLAQPSPREAHGD